MAPQLFTLLPEKVTCLSHAELLLAAGAITSLADGNGETALDLALAGNHDDVCQLLLMHMGSEPPPTVSETEHSPHTHQIQLQTQKLETQPQSTSNRSPYFPSIYQLPDSIHHALSFKHWEEDEEEEKMDTMKQEDDRD